MFPAMSGRLASPVGSSIFPVSANQALTPIVSETRVAPDELPTGAFSR
jgi:hypothetical protein